MKNKIFLAMILALSLFDASSHASVKCSALDYKLGDDNKSVHQMICSNEELMMLDAKLSNKAISLSSNPNVDDIKAHMASVQKLQDEWRKDTRDGCKTVECLKLQYKARISLLESWADD